MVVLLHYHLREGQGAALGQLEVAGDPEPGVFDDKEAGMLLCSSQGSAQRPCTLPE